MPTAFDWKLARFLRIFMLAVVFLSGCAVVSDCHALTIGPVEKIVTVIVEPGQPVQVMEPKEITVKVQPIGDKSVAPNKVKINIGGWLLITRWDWAVYETRLKALRRIEESSPAMKELVKNAIDEVKKDSQRPENRPTSANTAPEFEDMVFVVTREGRGDGAATRKIYTAR